ncbi:hypothetical protein [Clostridium fessum]|uniref:hypothetical protein n=1 Tax=Clostridium fessum TaxID=2126740 RepID=UPI003999B4E5
MAAVTWCYSVRTGGCGRTEYCDDVTNLFNIIYLQLGSCISIVVGQYLGAGELEEAKDADNK